MTGKTHQLTLTAQDFQVLEEAAGFSLDDEARKEVATYIRYALTGLFASAEGLVLGNAERGALSRYIGLLNRAHKVLENDLARQLGVELTRIYQSKTEPDKLVVITKFWLDIAPGQQADQILAQLIEQANVTLRAAQATKRGQRYRAGEDALITLFRAVHKRAKKRNNSRGQKIAGQNGDAFVGAINEFLDREGRPLFSTKDPSAATGPETIRKREQRRRAARTSRSGTDNAIRTKGQARQK